MMKIRNLLVNRIFLVVLIFCTSFIYFSAQAQAADTTFIFTLSGTQEVPPNASPGAGICNVTLNDVSGAVSVSCTFSGLIGNPTASHIHGLASVGVNAKVMLALIVAPGTITGNGVLTPEQVAGMINGMTYINLHTTAFPGGELRGQVIPEIAAVSPIPTLGNAFLVALTMLLLLAGVLILRRRLE